MKPSLSEKYKFSDFTLANYIKLLDFAAAKYQFSTYSNAPNPNDLIWRHDVDFSLLRALKMAQIEAEKGIRSHYFLMLSSQYYNLLAPSGIELCHRLRDLGHDIGLHFDAVGLQSEVEETVLIQKNLLEHLTGISIRLISFHNPTTISKSVLENEFIAGLHNIYAPSVRDNYDYCSDSNGYWRFDSFYDFLNQKHLKPLHMLSHPVWWSDTVLSPYKRICDDIRSWGAYGQKIYEDGLRSMGRENIGFEDEFS